MADYLRQAFKSLWDFLPWGHGQREVGSGRSSGTQHSYLNGYGHQSHNNNRIYTTSGTRKRKSDHLDLDLSGGAECEAQSAKFQRLIQKMSQDKQKRYGHPIRNGSLEASKYPLPGFPYSAKTSNLLQAAGVKWTANPGTSAKPYGLRTSLQADEKSRGYAVSSYNPLFRRNVADGLKTGWDSDDESFKTRPTSSGLRSSQQVPVKATALLKPEIEIVSALPGSSIRNDRKEKNGPTPLFGGPKNSRHSRLFSAPQCRGVAPRRFTSVEVVASPRHKPEVVDLENENTELEIIDHRPKIFTSSPADPRQGIEVRNFFPSRLSAINRPPVASSLSPPVSPPAQRRSETDYVEDDDLIIVAEKIISPKHSPFRTNSLELEMRSTKCREKSWLDESLGIFHDNRKFREDRIDYETKKLAILRNKSALTSDIEKRIRDNLTLTDIIILEEEEPKLPELTQAMQEFVEISLRGRENDVLVITSSNIQVTKGDIKTLQPGQWLNDNVINSYMDMISARTKADDSLPKVHVFSTFFYPKYLKEGYSNILKRWTRKVDIFAVDQIIFPIHLGVHWCLAVADHRTRTLKFYDSLFGNHMRALEALLSYMCNEHKERKKSALETSNWKLIQEGAIPGQENGSDCGVFTCQFAEYLSRDAKLTFTQKQMPYFRHRMIYETVKQNILVA